MAISTEKKAKVRKRVKTFSAIFKLVLLLVILIGLPLYIYFFQRDFINNFSNQENIEVFLNEYRAQSVFIYIGSQILQIVICIIPGQWLQFAAGYMYGFWLGYLFSLAGAFLGTIITYYVAKILGHDAMHLIFGEEKIQKMLVSLNSKKAVVLVPHIPDTRCPKRPLQLCSRAIRNETEAIPGGIPYRQIAGDDGKPSHRKTDLFRRLCQRCSYRSYRHRIMYPRCGLQEKADHPA